MIKILLVDDQPEFLKITRIFLEKDGNISVETASSAESALALLTANKYDAIVSDYEMGGMDGIAFLEEFKRMALDKPFIIFTGRSREDVVIRALNSGADFYLQKSGDAKVQYAELRNMIHQSVTRKRMEDALIRSEINHRTIVECTDDSIYTVDRFSRYLFMNSHHMKRLGIENGSYEGRSYWDYHTLEESKSFEESVHKVVESKISLQEEYSRNNRWFIRRISPVWNATLESVIAVTVVSTEVTERKKMEEDLRLSEENYRIVVESTQDSIYTVDPKGNYVFMNDHHKKRLGIFDEKYRSRNYSEYHSPEDSRHFSDLVEQVTRSRTSLEDRYCSHGKSYLRRLHPIFSKPENCVNAIAVISIEMPVTSENSPLESSKATPCDNATP
ncbi:MAG: response regulator [Methanoregulaceae archaeon]